MPLLPLSVLLFDLDGTLTEPMLDFDAIRAELGVPVGMRSVLDFIHALPLEQQPAAHEILLRHEHDAAARARPNRGLDTLIEWLQPRRRERPGEIPLQVGVVTRNCRPAAERTLARLQLRPDVLISREDAPPKPAPDALQAALARLQRLPAEAAMIGDYRYDIEAGRAAGVVLTVFVSNGNPDGDPAGADEVVTDLGELVAILDRATGPV